MTPTIAQMYKWYDEFNISVFNLELPRITIEFDNTKRRLGVFSVRNGGITKIIKISLYYDRTEEQYKNCLLHEMCHYYCWNKGWYYEHHGARWKAIAARATAITGLKIQRVENIEGWEVSESNMAKASKPMVVIVRKLADGSGDYFAIKTTKYTIAKDLVWRNNRYVFRSFREDTLVGIYIIDGNLVSHWVTSRCCYRGHRISPEKYEGKYKGLFEKAIRVENVIDLCHGKYNCLGVA